MYEQFEEKTFARSLEVNYTLPTFIFRICEITAVIAGLFLFLPVLLCCALLVWVTSPGTILFRQERVGQNGKVFTLYKFRTMVMSSNGLPITAENDQRITPIGRLLRKTKFDELPQFYNILRGEMCFVGPRPELAELVDFACPLWQQVLSVRPGITDPVTLQFRNEGLLLACVEDKQTFYREIIQPYKLNGYLQYLKKKSLSNDLKIIVQTIKVVMFPKTAPPINIGEIHFSHMLETTATDQLKRIGYKS